MWKRGHGKPLAFPSLSDIRRFLAKVVYQASGCWDWTARRSADGYGEFKFLGAKVRAHRLAYRIFCGVIGAAMDVHHKCKRRCCVNPAHLEAVDASDHARDENQSRGDEIENADVDFF